MDETWRYHYDVDETWRYHYDHETKSYSFVWIYDDDTCISN